MERFRFKKLKEEQGKEQYHVEISNRFAALEDLAEMDIDSAWFLERISAFQTKGV
jgi:hypothetical protein